jgi:Fe2+ or Zn2+ uptake regulation protein
VEICSSKRKVGRPKEPITVYEVLRQVILEAFHNSTGVVYAEELKLIAADALAAANLQATDPLQSVYQTVSNLRKEGYVIAFDRGGYAYVLVKEPQVKRPTEVNTEIIDAAVHRTIQEYGEVLKKLSREGQ